MRVGASQLILKTLCVYEHCERADNEAHLLASPEASRFRDVAAEYSLIVITAVALVIGVPICETVREWCRIAPDRRPWLIAAAVAILTLVAIAAPGTGELDPPLSESPGGIFVIFANAAVLGLLTVIALATLFGAISRSPNR